MTITLSTPTLSLNNGGTYGLIAIDLGPNRRDEVWVEPFGSDLPVLAKAVNRRTTVTISLVVKGTSAGNLVNLVEAVRNQFNGQSNLLTYANGGTAKVMTTYDSAIDPPAYGDIDILGPSHTQFLIPRWTFSVTRDAKFQSDTRPVVA